MKIRTKEFLLRVAEMIREIVQDLPNTLKIQIRSMSVNDIIAASIILLVTGFLIFKSIVSSFTYDESMSYLHGGVLRSYIDILVFKFVSANNHILNTLWLKFSSGIFGPGEFWLRLHSIASFLVFGIFGFWILKILKLQGSAILLLLIIFNPFLIDFFSLARGYSLGLGFGMTALYFSFKYLDKYGIKDLKYSLIMGSLMVFSIFSFIYLYIAILLSIIVITFIKNRDVLGRISNFWKPVLTGVFITGLAISWPIIMLRNKEQLYYGGIQNFWSDSVISLLNASYYDARFSVENSMINVVIVLLIIAALITVYLLIRRKKIRSDGLLLVHSFLIFAFIYALSELNFRVLETRYLFERTGLFLVPVFMFIVCGLLHISLRKVQILYFAVIIVLGSTVVAYTTFVQIKYYDSYLYCVFDANTKAVLKDVLSEHKSDSLDLSVEHYFDPTMRFYKRTNNLWNFNIKTDQNDSTFLNSKYVYLTNKSKLNDSLKNLSDFRIKYTFPYSGNIYRIHESVLYVRDQ